MSASGRCRLSVAAPTVDDMAEIVLFHHIRGLTSGVVAWADQLRAAGHTVHTPDVFEGRTFDSISEGQDYLSEIGFETAVQRSVAAAEALPAEVVYAGMSLGVMAAQQLVQERPGARGALLYASFADPDSFGGGWPADLPAQIHSMDADPFFVGEGDIDAARPVVEASPGLELHLYPGDGHLFFDSSVSDYDAAAAGLVLERSLALLAGLDGLTSSSG